MLSKERDRTREAMKGDPVKRALDIMLKVCNLDVQWAAARLATDIWWMQEGRLQGDTIPLLIDWLKQYEVEVNKVLGRGPAPDDPVSIAQGRLRRAQQLFEFEGAEGDGDES